MIKAYFIGGTQDLSVRMIQPGSRYMRFPIYPKAEACAFKPSDRMEPIQYQEEVYEQLTRLPDGSYIYVPQETLR